MRKDSEENKIELIPSINDLFENSDLYPNFGMVNMDKGESKCCISFIVTASDDIEISKVVDFLKDYIPGQLDDVEKKPVLERFKIVNEKILKVLSETLDKESFIDVHLAYVLIKGEFFYVSLGNPFDLIIFRGDNQYDLRKGKDHTFDGSGILAHDDVLELAYNNNPVIEWQNNLIIEKNDDKKTYQDTEKNYDIDNVQISEDPEIEKVVTRRSRSSNRFADDNIEMEESYNTGSTLKDKVLSILNKGKGITSNIFQKISPKIKPFLQNIFQYIGDAFSYILSLFFRGKGRTLGKNLPNKKKGFLIISLIVFLMLSLFLFIKSNNEENQRKQAEQKYQSEIALVDTNITKVIDSYKKVTLGDVSLQNQIKDLTQQVKNIQNSSLKDKFLTADKLNNFNARILSLQDKVDYVLRIDESSVLSRFEGLQKNANPTGLTLKDKKLYYTDFNNSKVVQVDTMTGSMDDIVTSANGLSKPLGLDFSKTSLLVLDTTKGILSVDIANKQVKTLAGYDSILSTSTAIKTYVSSDTDNFYLLQPSLKSIQRVPGLNNGSFAVAGRYNPTDFEDVNEDFTIIDGKVFTIDNQGVVNKYNRISSAKVDKETFTIPVMKTAIGAGARIFGMTPREEGPVFFFISDPKNNRILVFDIKNTTGVATFKAQYMPQSNSPFDFKSVKGLSLEEDGGRITLYALSSYGVFKINVNPDM